MRVYIDDDNGRTNLFFMGFLKRYLMMGRPSLCYFVFLHWEEYGMERGVKTEIGIYIYIFIYMRLYKF